MTINGHLLLLVVATGLFVRVWSANDQSKSRSLMRTRCCAAVACPPHPGPVNSDFAAVFRPVSALTSTTPKVEEIWTPADCPIPLPAGMGFGNYRVVDDTGRVARLEIAATDGSITGTNLREVAADFHMTSVGMRRWYFIRLHPPIALNAGDGEINTFGDAASETQSNTGAFLNRKFDFTGYVELWQSDESIIGESVIEEIARPDPPDLPVPR